MIRESNIGDLDLHAYVDGELDGAQARAVEEALARNSLLAARLAAYRADKAEIKRLYAPLADEPLPAAWIERIRNAPETRARPLWRLMGAIAAALLIFAGAASLYLNRHPSPGDAVETALQIRARETGAVKSITVSDLAEARRYDGTLDQVAHVRVQVPDLGRVGYRIAGLRFYENAAEILYRDGNDRLLTVYLRASDGKTRFDQFEEKGLRICVWQDDRITTVLAGDMSAAMMQRLASLTYLGLTA